MLALEGRDLRELALIERKKILRRLIQQRSSFVLFADHVEGGVAISLPRLRTGPRRHPGEVEGRPYRPDVAPSSWIKIKNPEIARRGTGPSYSNGNT